MPWPRSGSDWRRCCFSGALSRGSNCPVSQRAEPGSRVSLCPAPPTAHLPHAGGSGRADRGAAPQRELQQGCALLMAPSCPLAELLSVSPQQHVVPGFPSAANAFPGGPRGDVLGEEGSRLPAAWRSWGPRQREGTAPGSQQHQRCSQNRQGGVRKCFGKVQEGWLGKISHRGWLQPAVTEAQLPSLCLRRLCSGSPRAPRPAGRSRSCRSRALPALTPCCNPSRA